MIDESWRRVRRILAVRLDNLGDVLVTTPAIHAIRTALPNATISLLASPAGAQVGRLNRDVAEVLVYEAPWVDPWQRLPHCLEREQEIVERLRRDQFDAAVIFTSFRQSSLPAAYLCYLAGIPLRLAASVDGSGSLLTTRHLHPEIQMHEVERGLDLVASIGIPAADRHLVLTVPDDARLRAHAHKERWTGLRGRGCKGPLVIVHPGSSMPARRYPPEQYAEVIGALVEYSDAIVVLTGVDAECDLVARITRALAPEIRLRVHDVSGRLPFPDLCALIELADLVVTNNTGPMHIAAATATPVIALFALTNPPEQWGPWMAPHRILNRDVACRLCYCRVCPNGQECLTSITARDVVNAAHELGVGTDRQRILAAAQSADSTLMEA